MLSLFYPFDPNMRSISKGVGKQEGGGIFRPGKTEYFPEEIKDEV